VKASLKMTMWEFLSLSYKKSFLIATTDNFILSLVILSTFYHSLRSLTLQWGTMSEISPGDVVKEGKIQLFMISHQQFLLSHYLLQLFQALSFTVFSTQLMSLNNSHKNEQENCTLAYLCQHIYLISSLEHRSLS
jgi:hypothetical protein